MPVFEAGEFWERDMSNYILEGKKPVKMDDVIEWGKWFETADRTVRKTKIDKDTEVSTVFLGVDHDFLQTGDPVLFETMVFVKGEGNLGARYTTWDAAEKGHKDFCKVVFKVDVE